MKSPIVIHGKVSSEGSSIKKILSVYISEKKMILKNMISFIFIFLPLRKKKNGKNINPFHFYNRDFDLLFDLKWGL
ncbi:MAG: hypothetical protein UR25_C0002G0040 [Candidatus Nomurabacteria bacterium GW2011_GWE1_32_28]|uniref:Uncharacterized protein n=1 Tax=Candidatus Nomurabacteria bacterium GW2011_GWF1_31_48 TaxID=1618767 RepID=A0A0F9YFL4_9BACT|nr:MAG: hypothetical protein UR10_C0002G0040 [Candidatus Nomurabacteria bacterium GW2011_GWF2_30_133]KKP29071.1 MAG: hypothetical protein UR18_C0001G0192 [Candidatus Nomurabacteria bacterium GW2011_GWE2_31_40]KKP30519.1 MAG: hypothetical protein UR19_C0002G0040 [Candidatus Nomurabacteria bacterium GW2011_GWF1_31_48]KKP35004.1 MAG: hypothetical protein UR25_C0002G0040 [Candidatus Nomurabacteria bacterium GW2011_GWE1_32_28]HAS80628.1 hypothetical protein [Candidatus Nomurabacteria bacterium]